MPNSYIGRILESIPSIISGAMSKNLSLSKVATLIQNVNVIVVADFPLPANLSSNSSLGQISSYLKGFNIDTANNSNINMSGHKGFLINENNVKIAQLNNLSFADTKVALAVIDNDVCMVFGLASANSSLGTLQMAFNRVMTSIKCKE